jgi:hypothetical protein
VWTPSTSTGLACAGNAAEGDEYAKATALRRKRESGRSKWSSLEEFDSLSLEPGKVYEGEVTETRQGRRTYWHYSIHVMQEEAITVPAGVFQTVQIEEKRSRPGYSSTFRSYASKDPNLVVHASYSDSDGTDNSCELVSASGG